MPPKKATRASAAAPKDKATTAKASTTKASVTKRKATEEVEDEAPKKRGRPARPASSSSATPAPASKPAKAAARTPAVKKTTKATSTTAAKAPTTKAATTKAAADKPAANTSAKRKSADDTAEAPAKKRKTPAKRAATPKPAKPAKVLPTINEAPTETLDVFVCGENENGELGLGAEGKVKSVKRPRYNALLAADKVGVVQLSTGGMHVVALTHDNKILTWGVNDQSSLGRDTTWDGGLRDIGDDKDEDDSDKEDEDSGLNPREATPTEIPSDSFPEDATFAQVAAADNASFALTTDGRVFGWGTFRDNQGILGFSKDVEVQKTPVLVPELKNITQLACGENFVLALDTSGSVWAWGAGQQHQLGRRVVERTRLAGLTPREFGLPKKTKVKYVACGQDHSFAVDEDDNVWTWGLNNYGQCGIFDDAGADESIIAKPTKVESLAGYTMSNLKGGRHHSVGVSDKGELLVWGRCDGAQVGIDLSDLPKEDLINDERGKPRILAKPTAIPELDVKYGIASSDHCLAITTDGKAYSWGLSASYQTGQGEDDDVEVATHIDNTAVRGKKLNWCGAGGQYSILTSLAAISLNGAAPAKDGVDGIESAN